MTTLVTVFWKGSIVWGDKDHSSVFLVMVLDDLFSDTILGFQNLDFFLLLSIFVMIIRLILRDTGKLEDWLNDFWEWNKPGNLCKEELMEELQMTEKEKAEYRMYRKLNHHAKYIKIAKMDLLSEHLSVLVIPLLLLTDRYFGGDCLFACGQSEQQIWTSVGIFIALFFVKSGVNKIVLRIQDRQMDSLQKEVDEFEDKWGKIERTSLLNVWGEYVSEEEEMPGTLHEQVDVAKTMIMERNFVWFVVVSCSAARTALCTPDQCGWS
eukprot:TRINITY_DN1796_c0_g1_i3.p1 TRINITY_DN1796_c0_g1~~TRINITY_DN1796_c0_g1_i3.p1  ORF type:complete len:266 (-),score=99.70 TRINITY_DN1796_c0_g1_i3:783-1580(-)